MNSKKINGYVLIEGKCVFFREGHFGHLGLKIFFKEVGTILSTHSFNFFLTQNLEFSPLFSLSTHGTLSLLHPNHHFISNLLKLTYKLESLILGT
jgi:hypothetical protein